MISIEKIDIVSIPLAGNNIIELHNIALAPRYDSNLISLGQLRKSRITYYNSPTVMTLIRDRKIIVEAKKERNIFMLDLAYLIKAMAIISPQSKAKAPSK